MTFLCSFVNQFHHRPPTQVFFFCLFVWMLAIYRGIAAGTKEQRMHAESAEPHRRGAVQRILIHFVNKCTERVTCVWCLELPDPPTSGTLPLACGNMSTCFGSMASPRAPTPRSVIERSIDSLVWHVISLPRSPPAFKKCFVTQSILHYSQRRPWKAWFTQQQQQQLLAPGGPQSQDLCWAFNQGQLLS